MPIHEIRESIEFTNLTLDSDGFGILIHLKRKIKFDLSQEKRKVC